ncbi:hypothetical protein ATCC90586_007326 [Pythium insidiosum]|nr:hypothetical protein ATCC90586_007326 [Pythium insidiosum]
MAGAGDVALAVGSAAVLVLAFLLSWLRDRCFLRQHLQWAELHAPLRPDAMEIRLDATLRSSNLRLDAALRDAEEGFNVCAACGFENLKRNIFCSICGVPIDCQESDSVAKKKKSRPKSSKEVEDSAASTATAYSNERRQRRARRRREWIRKVDVEGKMFWYRDVIERSDDTDGAKDKHRHPGLVLVFEDSRKDKEEEEEDVASVPEIQPESEPEKRVGVERTGSHGTNDIRDVVSSAEASTSRQEGNADDHAVEDIRQAAELLPAREDTEPEDPVGGSADMTDELYALLKGVYEVVPPEMLMLFDAEELDYVLSGSDEIDVEDWRRNSKWTMDLIDHPVIEWFWELVREMSNEYRRRLLVFSTGSSRVPLAGFSALTSYDGRLCPFTLKGIDVSESEYIRSHACFNRLDLPLYDSKQTLKTVLYGVLNTEMHGFTTQ